MSHPRPTPLRTVEYSPASACTATEHWTGPVHWTHYRPAQPRADAPTLVLVHGAGHNEQVWTLGPDNWIGYFTRLGYEVLTVSLRGHKPSKGLVTFQTLQRYVQDVHVPTEALGLADEEVVYIGHSMGGIIIQMLFAQHTQLAGVVVVDSFAPHRALSEYAPFLTWLRRHHSLTFLKTLVNAAAMFSTDALVRELLVGEEVSADVVTALRRTLGGETSVAVLEMWQRHRRGCQPRPGNKLLFIGAAESAFYPPAAGEASASEQGAPYVQVPGKHNIMLTASARLAAQTIADFLVRLLSRQPALVLEGQTETAADIQLERTDERQEVFTRLAAFCHSLLRTWLGDAV